MPDTRKPISQVVATSRERAARFALQMAEQARKFGARIAELRDERQWKQRDLVAAMVERGDQALNTNQLSRYENGGAMPGEQRQQWFADALGTSVADLHAGPMAERSNAPSSPDPFAPPADDALQQILARLRNIELALGVTDDPVTELERDEETEVHRRRSASNGSQTEAPAPGAESPGGT